MIYLLTADFKTQISEDVLTKITEADPTILTEAERIAISEVTSYIFRYDVAATFAQTGNARDGYFVSIIVDIVLYQIHKRVNPRQIPEIRFVAYQDAKKWLEAVSKGLIVANLPKKNDDADGDGVSDSLGTMKIFTFPKRSNNY